MFTKPFPHFKSMYVLKSYLILIHTRVRPFKNVCYAAVITVSGHAAGQRNITGCRILFIQFLYCFQQIFHILVIVSLGDYGKLIAADVEDRAVLVNIADDLAALPDILVAGLVPLGIIYLL